MLTCNKYCMELRDPWVHVWTVSCQHLPAGASTQCIMCALSRVNGRQYGRSHDALIYFIGKRCQFTQQYITPLNYSSHSNHNKIIPLKSSCLQALSRACIAAPYFQMSSSLGYFFQTVTLSKCSHVILKVPGMQICQLRFLISDQMDFHFRMYTL